MKRNLVGLLLILLGGAILASCLLEEQASRGLFGLFEVALAVAGVLVSAGVLVLATSRSNRSAALLRLDAFLPFLKKKKKNAELPPPGIALRTAQAVLPASWLSDRVTGKPGSIRKALKRLGPSVLSAPLRRVVQGLCLVLFLILFFYVCTPYDARPAAPGEVSHGWRLQEIEAETGNLRLTQPAEPEKSGDVATSPWFRSVDTVHVVEEGALDDIRGEVGAFTVVASDESSVTLSPEERLTDEQLETFLLSSGGWALHERSPWPSHYAENLAGKEWVSAEVFLLIDPLVSISTSLAGRSWAWSLACAAVILIACILIPRGFCGYLCPLGTVIDLFDWSVSNRVKRFRVTKDGWWVHIKYYLLTGVLVSALLGVLVSGYVSAIPVITRALLFLGSPLQTGLTRGWSQVVPLNAGHFVSIGLFFLVLALGFLKPRFWCKYVCPSGAVFSLGNLFRVTERKVESSCINCNKCVEICPFDAIKPDFTTRVTDCTMCQTCAGVCPTHAIKFVERWNVVELKVLNDPPTHETALGRRGFISLTAGAAAAVVGGGALATITKTFGAGLDAGDALPPVRPPGSLPEKEFLEMCIRCGECFKACPFDVLQPMGFSQGLEGLWTPQVIADHAGCASSCNSCGQVCPTGAIRALPLAEKKVARMGLAIVNEQTCLPLAGKEACQLCVDECSAAGYHAIEFTRVHTEVDDDGLPIEGSGYLAPVVLADECVGCGLCQMSCYQFNVHQTGKLGASAIVVEAGPGKEDRLHSGSYRQLRRDEARKKAIEQQQRLPEQQSEFYVPDDAAPPSTSPPPSDSPFGVPAEESPFGVPAEENPFGLPAAGSTGEPDADPFGLGQP
ncbi:4Fe-4S binding protein [Lignipirellula cremea]|uniref:Electron transport protein YccM n=1 Tax=Lignipirellula cremea TaxID=2528010 RepID=A0A518DVR0_9BACT|nr:4Fe-4S binding protein [Lignipirellula cremea]QDU95924.1 Putative electron transport protein YccM [Lignipirellula cremea]